MTRIWVERDKRIRRDRGGKPYTLTLFCVEKENLKLMGNTIVYEDGSCASLAPQPATLLRFMMLRDGLCTYNDLIGALYPNPDDESENSHNNLRKLMNDIRVVIRDHGWEIRAMHLQGYTLQRVAKKETVT